MKGAFPWIAAASGVLVVVLLIVGAGVKRMYATPPRLRTSNAIVAALAEREARTYPRPVHRGTPVPGRFGDAVDDAKLAEVQAWASAGGPLEPTEKTLRELLAATTRAEGGLGPSRALFAPHVGGPLELPGAKELLGPTAEKLRSPRFGAAREGLAVCRRAVAQIEHDLASGDAASAVTTCADTAAWARDVVLGNDLMGAMLMIACVDGLMNPPCRRALGAAEPARRKEAAHAIDVVRRALPDVGEVLRDDQLVGFLRQCGGVFDDASRSRLTPVQRAIAGELTAEEATHEWSAAASSVKGCGEQQAFVEKLLTLPSRDVGRVANAEKYVTEWAKLPNALDALVHAAD